MGFYGCRTIHFWGLGVVFLEIQVWVGAQGVKNLGLMGLGFRA